MVDDNSTEQITEAVSRLEQGGAAARDWVEKVRIDSSSVANQAESLVEYTRRARLSARRIGGSLHRRNCVGVFGPSQAGKSYLVSALAKRKDAPLLLDFAGQSLDFLKEINPAGGKESTGLVSRFTRHKSPLDAKYPVELRLLSETDLVKIISNSFLSDFDPSTTEIEQPDDDAIRQTVRELEADAGVNAKAAAHLDEIELFDLGEYFRQSFPNRIRDLNRAGYWDAIIRIGGRLPLSGRAKLFALLWGNLDAFTSLFTLLAGALEKIGNPDEVHAELGCLTPRLAGTPPQANTIIDVAVLGRLGMPEDANDTIRLKPVNLGDASATAELPRATLCALTAEVKLVMQDAPWPFMDHTDLLDFPGARSRLKLRNLNPVADDADDDRNAGPRKLFLRGKIAFLFQRYTAELELTSMLLCMPPGNQEVKDLTGMVREWIAMTHGSTPAARKRILNGLFLVLTKFDDDFTKKGGEDAVSISQKWDTRLHASFLELYGDSDWAQDWDGSPFDNTVFLRNPNIEQVHLMAYENRDQLLEAGPAPDSASMIADFRESFEQSLAVQRHIRDRGAVWDAAMTPNDGGVAYLVERLSGALDPGLKRRQGSERLIEAVERLEDALRAFHHGDGDEARDERDKRIQETRRVLLAAIRTQDYRGFARLLDALSLPEGDARGVFYNVAAMREEDLNPVAAEPAETAADDDPWATGDDPWAADDGVEETDVQPERRRRERSDIFAEQAVGHWVNRMSRLQQDQARLSAIGIPAEIADEIIKDLRIGADRLDISGRIAEAVRSETMTAGARWEDAVDRAVRIASFEINDFISYLGFGGLELEERPGFPEAPREPKRRIFSMPEADPSEISIGESRAAIEAIFFVDWGVALRNLGLSNVSHDSGREISDEDNRELGRIIETIDVADALRAVGAEPR